MNHYLKNLNKIEFVVTNECTGRCKHCSQGDHVSCGEHISADVASEAVKKISKLYDVKTVMTFGGEPLLYPEIVYSIMSAAREVNVPKRQIITNGFFTNRIEKMRDVARRLAECGVNDLLLSVDAFHQETIPTDIVKAFAVEIKEAGIPIRLQPAWLIDPLHENPYNIITSRVLDSFADIHVPIGEGNVIFPEGNALIFLSEYFKDVTTVNPYVEDPYDVRCLSFSANGDLLDGNVYERDVIEIIDNYRPRS